jgi:hypothetical protein
VDTRPINTIKSSKTSFHGRLNALLTLLLNTFINKVYKVEAKYYSISYPKAIIRTIIEMKKD